jgi:uncharacterized surface protein with fasciclin (FAS1) repeats
LSASLFACGDDDDTNGTAGTAGTGGAAGMGGAGGGEPSGTINYTGIAAGWLDGVSSAGFTVCVHDTETCTATDDEGNFTLEGVAADSELIITFVADDGARIAFPIVTGADDMTADRSFTVVNRSIADILVASAPGATGGVDDAKSILTFYVGNGGYANSLRGLPGVTVAYDGPDADKAINYIIPIAGAPGVGVGDQSVTETGTPGNGFVANVEPGDYTMTFDADGRDCTPDFGWPGAEGSAANTFRVPTIPGFATFTFIRCQSDTTVSANGTVFEFGTGGPMVGGEVCMNWAENDDGTFANTNCETTNENGLVVHNDLPADTQFLAVGSKDDYMTVIGTFETLIDDITWAGFSAPVSSILLAAASVGVTVDDSKGHVIMTVINENGESLDGYDVTIADSEISAVYASSTALDPSMTATGRNGFATFFNLDAGNYVVTVEKEGVLCTTNATSWLTVGGYAAPVQAGAMTIIAVTCIDEPGPLFGEPAEAIDAPMCSEDEGADNCATVCGFFVACGVALCPGIQDSSEWAISAATSGMQAACEASCEETPQLIDIVCQHSSCNETLSLAVASQEGFGDFCNSGLTTLLDTATAAAEAEGSIVTTAFDLVSATENIVTTLGNEGPMTVFLPVDAAFALLDSDLVDMVVADEMLRELVLSYHIVEAGLAAADVVAAIEGGLESIDTLGGPVSLALVDGQVLVGGATVIQTDIFASNGVVHLIDTVILPPEPAGNDEDGQ